MLKASAFTFGTLLTIYLFGLASARCWRGHGSSACAARPWRFSALQAFVGLYAAASVAVLVWLLRSMVPSTSLRIYVASYEPLDMPGVRRRSQAEAAGESARSS